MSQPKEQPSPNEIPNQSLLGNSPLSLQQNNQFNFADNSALVPSGEIKNYESIVPGSANRIITMTEKEQAHRHSIDFKVIHQNTVYTLSALFLLLCIFVASGYYFYLGQDIAGFGFLVTGALSIVSSIIAQRKQ